MALVKGHRVSNLSWNPLIELAIPACRISINSLHYTPYCKSVKVVEVISSTLTHAWHQTDY
jgi:hypothetical protein